MRGNAIIQTLCIGWLTTSKLYDQLSTCGIRVPLFAIAAAGLVVTYGIGWVENRLGLWQTEAEILWEINPKQKKLTDDKISS